MLHAPPLPRDKTQGAARTKTCESCHACRNASDCTLHRPVRCYVYGPHIAFGVPDPLSQHHITLTWHRSGAHQLACNIGGYTHYRHQQLLRHLLDGLKAAGR